MVPVLGREVEEGEQSFPVLGQAGDRLVVLGAVLVGEHIDGRLGCRAGRRTVNFTKVCLHVDLDREGNFVSMRAGKSVICRPSATSIAGPTASLPAGGA